MQPNNSTIGVLGGMGTYATIHLFRQYARIFPAKKEWERPRIIIDNRCTMPSRVRAALYGENREQLVNEMSDSIHQLIRAGCDRILLACNTSHLFLPDIFRQVPEAEGRVVNIIEVCMDGLSENGIKDVFLLASEATIESRIYQKSAKARGIRCKAPQKEEYRQLRSCIEAVKQNEYTEDVRRMFSELIRQDEACILGCSELPILYEMYRGAFPDIDAYDPVCLALCRIKKEEAWQKS